MNSNHPEVYLLVFIPPCINHTRYEFALQVFINDAYDNGKPNNIGK
ncbi:MAG: hypothetical protein WBG70_19840 [Spirulinaceae cyanobacterium]